MPRKTKKTEEGFKPEEYQFIGDTLKSLGYVGEKLILTTVFVYLWWRSYGKGRFPTKNDVLLGVVYAFTVPEALRGGTLANAYALAVLSALGVGFIPLDDIAEMFGGMVDGFGTAVGWAASGYMPWVTVNEPDPYTMPIAPTPIPTETEMFEQFKSECYANFGAVNYLQGAKDWRCSVPITLPSGEYDSIESWFYSEYLPCKQGGGTWDFKLKVCNRVTQSDI